MVYTQIQFNYRALTYTILIVTKHFNVCYKTILNKAFLISALGERSGFKIIIFFLC